MFSFIISIFFSEPISKAKTLINYNSADPDLMSFPVNAEALIYMKSAGIHSDIWYASINGKSGFVNSLFLKETKKIAQADIILPIENIKIPNVQPDKVQQPHEIFEGTTIYTTEPTPSQQQQQEITPTTFVSVKEDIAATANLDNVQNSVNNQNDNIIDTNIETLLNENTFSSINTAETSNLPEQDTKFTDEVIQHSNSANTPDDAQTNENIESESVIENNIKVEEKVSDLYNNNQVSNEPSSNHNLEIPKPDSPVDVLSEIKTENASNESIEVLEKVDLIQDLTKSDVNSVSTDSMFPTNINNVDVSQLPYDSPNLLNTKKVVDNVNILQLPDETPQVPISASEGTALDSETILGNNIQNINGEVKHQQINTLPDVSTLSPVLKESSQETINSNIVPPITSYAINTDTIPSADVSLNKADETFQTVETSNVTPETQTNVDTTEVQMNVESVTPEIQINMDLPAPITEVPLVESTTEFTLSTTPDDEVTETTPAVSSEYLTTSTENIIQEIFSEPTEPTPSQDDNSEGFISSIYTTIADMWPPSTEAPPEPIFNEEYIETSQNSDESDESFSFVKYLFNTYNLVMGTKEQSNALFPSVGK